MGSIRRHRVLVRQPQLDWCQRVSAIAGKSVAASSDLALLPLQRGRIVALQSHKRFEPCRDLIISIATTTAATALFQLLRARNRKQDLAHRFLSQFVFSRIFYNRQTAKSLQIVSPSVCLRCIVRSCKKLLAFDII